LKNGAQTLKSVFHKGMSALTVLSSDFDEEGECDDDDADVT